MLKLNIVKAFQWTFEYISVRSVRTSCIVQMNFSVEVSVFYVFSVFFFDSYFLNQSLRRPF